MVYHHEYLQKKILEKINQLQIGFGLLFEGTPNSLQSFHILKSRKNETNIVLDIIKCIANRGAIHYSCKYFH